MSGYFVNNIKHTLGGSKASQALWLIILFLFTYSMNVPASENKNATGKIRYILAAKAKQSLISKGRAISSVKSELKGKVLSARLIKSRGPAVYKVKILLAKGRVRTVFVDGHSGKIIRIN